MIKKKWYHFFISGCIKNLVLPVWSFPLWKMIMWESFNLPYTHSLCYVIRALTANFVGLTLAQRGSCWLHVGPTWAQTCLATWGGFQPHASCTELGATGCHWPFSEISWYCDTGAFHMLTLTCISCNPFHMDFCWGSIKLDLQHLSFMSNEKPWDRAAGWTCFWNSYCDILAIWFRFLSVLTHLPLDTLSAILADDIFSCIFMNEKFCISIQIWLKFVPSGPINNITALVQIMAWRRSGDKPLSKTVPTQFTDTYMPH